jgi:hypothetical protein
MNHEETLMEYSGMARSVIKQFSGDIGSLIEYVREGISEDDIWETTFSSI